MLATADDFGLVKLFDYPATGKYAKFKKYIVSCLVLLPFGTLGLTMRCRGIQHTLRTCGSLHTTSTL